MAIKNLLKARIKRKKISEELGLFMVNGLLATFIHFLTLTFLVNFSPLNYGLSNFFSFIVGSISSFLGNKFFVFNIKLKAKTFHQILKFGFLYIFLACTHGLALYWWSDIYNYNYIIGFLLITIINTVLSFLFNKYLIFNAK